MSKNYKDNSPPPTPHTPLSKKCQNTYAKSIFWQKVSIFLHVIGCVCVCVWIGVCVGVCVCVCVFWDSYFHSKI